MATYASVNDAWPDPMPVPTPKEAISGVKRLIKVAHRHARSEGIHFGLIRYSFKLTSGRRHTWPRRGVWPVNPNERGHGGGGGWGEIVHSVSHWAIRKYWPTENPHGPRHVWIESMLAAYVRQHFLDGQLVRPTKPKPPVNPIMQRAERVQAAIERWERKKRRAETALRKLKQKERYYVRRIGNPAVPTARANSNTGNREGASLAA